MKWGTNRESFFTQTPCQPIALYKPRPYKFEELKPNMWIWDDKQKFEEFFNKYLNEYLTGVKDNGRIRRIKK